MGIACREGIKEGEQYATLDAWWGGSQRAGYMLWLLREIGYDDQLVLRLLAVRFARETQLIDGRTVWDLLTDERSRQAVIVAARYANGEATGEELRAAMISAAVAAWESVAAAAATAASQQADVIRELIPAEEVRGYWERYITNKDQR